MRNPFRVLVSLVVLAVDLLVAVILINASFRTAGICIGLCALVVALLLGVSIKVANQWDLTMVLRLGKFYGLRGPGLFFMVHPEFAYLGARMWTRPSFSRYKDRLIDKMEVKPCPHQYCTTHLGYAAISTRRPNISREG